MSSKRRSRTVTVANNAELSLSTNDDAGGVTNGRAKSKRKMQPKAILHDDSHSNHNSTTTTTIADSTTVRADEGHEPWYNMFTKGDVEYNQYMATEWSVEKHGATTLFEKISLEGAQSGLSWLTVLRKRNAYRRVFHQFDIDTVAAMTSRDVQAILEETADDTRTIVVRHRGKIESVINNAQCIQKIMMKKADDDTAHEHDGDAKIITTDAFDTFLWSFVDHKPILNQWNGNLKTAQSKSEESIAMSKALKKLGFRFVGPTTCYAMMQSAGMVIDHPAESPEWKATLEYLKQRPGGFQDRR